MEPGWQLHRQIIINYINITEIFLSVMQIIFPDIRDCMITVKSTNYRLGWTFNQDPKASPGSRFSASVNMSSSGYDKNNSYNVADHVTTQRQSSVSYSKSWEGTPFNLSASMNHSQNVKNKTVSLNLPKSILIWAEFILLKAKNSTGPTKWYQELQFQYSASLDNQINTYDSLLFTNEVWNNMKNGFKHEAPLSFQIRPFRNFSISPSLTYTGVLYTQKIEKDGILIISIQIQVRLFQRLLTIQ